MRVLVCGGRDFVDQDWLDEKLYWFDQLYGPITTIIEGRARGADKYARLWSRAVLKKDSEGYDAKWDEYGKKAGYLRNKQMLEEGKPDVVIAFPGGKGTAMMVKLAKEAGVEVIEIGNS